MKNDYPKYYLVLEYRPGDFMPIDINILRNSRFLIDYTNLKNIDNFTKEYSESELREMILINNLVPNEYLDGKLHIINQNRYRFPVFTKDVVYSLPQFLIEHIDNKQIMNKFLNIYMKYNKLEIKDMKDAINERNIEKILNLLSLLSYENVRNIYMYIDQNIVTLEKRRVLENENAA